MGQYSFTCMHGEVQAKIPKNHHTPDIFLQKVKGYASGFQEWIPTPLDPFFERLGSEQGDSIRSYIKENLKNANRSEKHPEGDIQARVNQTHLEAILHSNPSSPEYTPVLLHAGGRDRAHNTGSTSSTSTSLSHLIALIIPTALFLDYTFLSQYIK